MHFSTSISLVAFPGLNSKLQLNSKPCLNLVELTLPRQAEPNGIQSNKKKKNNKKPYNMLSALAVFNHCPKIPNYSPIYSESSAFLCPIPKSSSDS